MERSNRILLDKATLLIDARLPMIFWAEAVATATYLRNVSLTKGGNNKTPLEMWAGREPTVSYLKRFGCLAYYYIPKVNRNKLQPRAKKEIFIGYSQETREYRIYDPKSRKINAVRTAKFDESVKGSELLDNKYRNEEEDIILFNETEQEENEEDVNAENSSESNQSDEHEEQEEEIDRQIQNRRKEIEEERQEERRYARRGRKPGITNEEIENVHKLELQLREERLREQGVRRSGRIEEKKHQANAAKHISIPATYTQAVNSTNAKEWHKAMEREIQAMERHKV